MIANREGEEVVSVLNTRAARRAIAEKDRAGVLRAIAGPSDPPSAKPSSWYSAPRAATVKA
jgi:hypothetical protein